MTARKLQARAAAIGLTALMLTATATPSLAVKRVDCQDQNSQWGNRDWFWIYQDNPDTPSMCFKNAGEAKVDIHGVTRISPGNNFGWFDYRRADGSQGHKDFNYKTEDHFNGINIIRLHFGK